VDGAFTDPAAAGRRVSWSFTTPGPVPRRRATPALARPLLNVPGRRDIMIIDDEKHHADQPQTDLTFG
jgi:hypothetical protein